MAVLTDSLLIDLFIGGLTLLVAFYYYLYSVYNYWRNRGIPYVKSPLIFGTLKDSIFGKRPIFEIHNEIYKRLEGEKFGGFFEMLSPNLLIRDPALIEKVLIKDFAHFQDRGLFSTDSEYDPLSTNLIFSSGAQWKYLRHKLTPTFTSGKLKSMFEQICNCGSELVEELKKYSQAGKPAEAKNILSVFTTDVIASCAFGLQFKHDSEDWTCFKKMSDNIFVPTRFRIIKFFIIISNIKLAKLLNLKPFSEDVNDYFLSITKSTINFRKQNNIKRKDFLQLLMSLKDQDSSGEKININQQQLNGEDAYLKQSDDKPITEAEKFEMTDEIIAAQLFVFLTAGSESASSMMHYTLYSIATNLMIQTRVQEEVDKVLAKHGQWNYGAVKEMTYLDQVIQEGLRIYPFTTNLNRICTIPYKIPETDIVLEKGLRISIPVYAIHMDPQYYPNPEIFDPERFKNNNYRSSSKYMPFGDGPRMCIAMRFAILEMKICLARILSEFSVSVHSKTVQPLQYEPVSFQPQIKNGIWLNFQQRNEQI